MGSGTVPWYKEHAKYTTLARQYIHAFVSRRDERVVANEFENYLGFSRAQLIFESNRMEGVGAPIGVTKQLIDEFLPPLPARYPAYRNTSAAEDVLLENLRRGFQALRSKYDMGHYAKFIPVRMGDDGKGIARSFMEVLYHAHAANNCYARGQLKYDSRSFCGTTRPELISEGYLKSIHSVMAGGLLPDSAGVPAGEYRKHDATIGGKAVLFVAHGNLADAMARYVREANRILDSDAEPFAAAATISYQFVKIHPFPDFNGRTSRLLLSMVMASYGVPFFLTFKSDAKNKARYTAALKRADQGNFDAYETLIARRLVESYREVDEHLVLTGVDPLVPADSQEERGGGA